MINLFSGAPLAAGMTRQTTSWTVNLPTRTEGIVIRLASTIDPSATWVRTVGSSLPGFNPIAAASEAGRTTDAAPVSKASGLVTLPLKVTSTQ